MTMERGRKPPPPLIETSACGAAPFKVTQYALYSLSELNNIRKSLLHVSPKNVQSSIILPIFGLINISILTSAEKKLEFHWLFVSRGAARAVSPDSSNLGTGH